MTEIEMLSRRIEMLEATATRQEDRLRLAEVAMASQQQWAHGVDTKLEDIKESIMDLANLMRPMKQEHDSRMAVFRVEREVADREREEKGKRWAAIRTTIYSVLGSLTLAGIILLVRHLVAGK